MKNGATATLEFKAGKLEVLQGTIEGSIYFFGHRVNVTHVLENDYYEDCLLLMSPDKVRPRDVIGTQSTEPGPTVMRGGGSVKVALRIFGNGP